MLKDDKKKLDNQTEGKPWESQFDDDRDDRGNLSRVASKSKEKGNTYFAIILGVLLVLMIAFPIIAYTIHSSRANRPVESSKIVVNTSDSDSASASASKKEAKKVKAASESAAKAASESKARQAESEKAASESQAAESSKQAAQAAAQAASESQAQAQAATQNNSSEATTQSSSSSETTGGSYTLKAGEGLYRAAVNNGLTLNQLLALNPGLTASSQVAPGTVLKVK